jgi:hypothetical protein
MISHTRAILCSASSHQNHGMLLYVMSYNTIGVSNHPSSVVTSPSLAAIMQLIHLECKRTFTRNIASNLLSIAQPHPSHLPLPRIRLLRLGDAHPDTHALHLRSKRQLRRRLLPRALGDTASPEHLLEGCAGVRRRCEGSGETRDGRGLVEKACGRGYPHQAAEECQWHRRCWLCWLRCVVDGFGSISFGFAGRYVPRERAF